MQVVIDVILEDDGEGAVQIFMPNQRTLGKGWYLNKWACEILGRQANRSIKRDSRTGADVQKVLFGQKSPKRSKGTVTVQSLGSDCGKKWEVPKCSQ